MAAAIWTVRKLASNRVNTVNGIDVVFGNFDNADSEAVVLADCHAAVIAAGHPIPPTGYFDTADLSLSAGEMDADEDFTACSNPREVIA